MGVRQEKPQGLKQGCVMRWRDFGLLVRGEVERDRSGDRAAVQAG